MSTIENGTRFTATAAQTVGASTRMFDRGYSRDVGLADTVTGPLVFTTSPPQVTLASSFGGFAAQNAVLVEGTNSNDGLFYVTAVDPSGNFLTLSPPPKPESPASATLRVA
jgi:hypothetical protein